MALPGYLEDTGKDLAKQMTGTYSVPIDTSKFAPQVAPMDQLQQDAITRATSGLDSYKPYEIHPDRTQASVRRRKKQPCFVPEPPCTIDFNSGNRKLPSNVFLCY